MHEDDFRWRPLAQPDRLRVLHIEPAQQYDDPLRASLTEHRLDGSASYIALSYHWGPNERRHPVVITNAVRDGNVGAKTGSNDQAFQGQRLIHDHLNLALRSIRSREHVVDLWTDGLCINQDDVQERADQVLRMTEIYSQAREVVVYLGESFPRELGFSFEQILSTLCDYSPSLNDTSDDSDVDREHMTWSRRGRSSPLYSKPKPREGDFLELQGPLNDFVGEKFDESEDKKHEFLIAADRFFSLPW
jgi:hypothetical protein